MTEHILKTKVSDSLSKIRPYLLADGGDVVLEEITSEGVAKVKLVGACKTCTLSEMTFKGGVKETVLSDVPELKDIVTI